ncbi:hypothetical protein BB558_004707 [Smittium angustum]|uniref:Homeobox domain-containing protein n=1 Tax=Smittium angustum TaxID=133377 RepID=A0A2U1J2M1_SMIAN|nr:hypothetical protein BB558_004707 [Smittium angustum]
MLQDFNTSPKPILSQPDFESNALQNNVLRQITYHSLQVKHRKRTTKKQFNTLETEFRLNNKPPSEKRKQIALALGMTSRAVQVWFQNRRAKQKEFQRRISHNHVLSKIPLTTTKISQNPHIIPPQNLSSPPKQTHIHNQDCPRICDSGFDGNHVPPVKIIDNDSILLNNEDQNFLQHNLLNYNLPTNFYDFPQSLQLLSPTQAINYQNNSNHPYFPPKSQNPNNLSFLDFINTQDPKQHQPLPKDIFISNPQLPSNNINTSSSKNSLKRDFNQNSTKDKNQDNNDSLYKNPYFSNDLTNLPLFSFLSQNTTGPLPTLPNSEINLRPNSISFKNLENISINLPKPPTFDQNNTTLEKSRKSSTESCSLLYNPTFNDPFYQQPLNFSAFVSPSQSNNENITNTSLVDNVNSNIDRNTSYFDSDFFSLTPSLADPQPLLTLPAQSSENSFVSFNNSSNNTSVYNPDPYLNHCNNTFDYTRDYSLNDRNYSNSVSNNFNQSSPKNFLTLPDTIDSIPEHISSFSNRENQFRKSLTMPSAFIIPSLPSTGQPTKNTDNSYEKPISKDPLNNNTNPRASYSKRHSFCSEGSNLNILKKPKGELNLGPFTDHTNLLNRTNKKLPF